MSRSIRPRIVGVIFSPADFRRAIKMRNPPALFELRLDGLVNSLERIQTLIRDLPAPFIATARHPGEGGANHLSASERRTLLLEFLPHAAFVDIESRSLRFSGAVLERAAANQIPAIISLHDLEDTPSRSRLDNFAAAARSARADIIKVATRTDTRSQLQRLFDFFDAHHAHSKIAAMGIGKLGRVSRIELLRRGSLLNYAHLGVPRASGQLSVAELRRVK
ncbi:MAG: type I 3-dehydroquinate dehydratase [Chthoniobacterales bacterium]